MAISPHPQRHQDLPLQPRFDPTATGDDKNHSFTPTHALYRDAVENADVFWKLLHQFHASIGKRIRIPKIGGKTLHLHLLFVEVTSRGGFEKPYTVLPSDICEHYGRCGAYGICSTVSFDGLPQCLCFEGFKPRDQEKWDSAFSESNSFLG